MEDLEKKLMKIIRSADRPMGTDTLSFLTGRSRWDVNKKLKTLTKWKQVRKVTAKKVDFWDFY